MRRPALQTLAAVSLLTDERDKQPRQRRLRSGELIATCGHVGQEVFEVVATKPDQKNIGSGFVLDHPIPCPDGPAFFLAVCRACLRAAKGNPKRATIRTHFPFKDKARV